jgi:hypothetical protein
MPILRVNIKLKFFPRRVRTEVAVGTGLDGNTLQEIGETTFHFGEKTEHFLIS